MNGESVTSSNIADQWAVMTTDEVGERLGVSSARVRQFVSQGRLVADRSGRSLLFEKSEVERFARQERKTGRPAAGERPALEAPAPTRGAGATDELQVLRQENRRLKDELAQVRQVLRVIAASHATTGHAVEAACNLLEGRGGAEEVG